ncbi:MAG: hypothetical protein D6732_12935, partial [Methanobacteriota archaeon]
MKSFRTFVDEAMTPNAKRALERLRAKQQSSLVVPKRNLITKQQLDALEKHLDALFRHLNIDIEFTKHFFERLHDARNKKDITIDELNDL